MEEKRYAGKKWFIVIVLMAFIPLSLLAQVILPGIEMPLNTLWTFCGGGILAYMGVQGGIDIVKNIPKKEE